MLLSCVLFKRSSKVALENSCTRESGAACSNCMHRVTRQQFISSTITAVLHDNCAEERAR